MQLPNLYLIAAVEVAALLVVVCMFLVFQNRSLRTLVRKLQERMTQLVADLRLARAEKAKKELPAPAQNYTAFLNTHIDQTKSHHQELGQGKDIVLDLDPDTPLPRRAAALRYAILLAEKEANTGKHAKFTDWKLLERKYEQLLQYQSTYASSDDTDSAEMDALRDELTAAKKRVSNLERFKALYFDLEEKWESCKDTAQNHFDELTQLAAGSENAEAIESVLQSYHSNYGELGTLIENGIDGVSILSADSNKTDGSAGEIRHLRAVAADQHRIITELQRKLKESTSAEQTEQVVHELQGQLQKQIRFVQESETCIQLLEDELTTANKELEQLKSRLTRLPQIKTELKELRDQNDDYEMQLYSLKSENRRLMSKLQNAKHSAPPSDDAGEVRRLKKEMGELENKYAELEEKFLDLKLQQ